MPKQTVEVLRAVLGYATFPNKEMRDQAGKMLDVLRDDLDDVGFEASTRMEDEMKEMERVLNDYDEKNTLDREALKEAVKEAREEEEAGG